MIKIQLNLYQKIMDINMLIINLLKKKIKNNKNNKIQQKNNDYVCMNV